MLFRKFINNFFLHLNQKNKHTLVSSYKMPYSTRLFFFEVFIIDTAAKTVDISVSGAIYMLEKYQFQKSGNRFIHDNVVSSTYPEINAILFSISKEIFSDESSESKYSSCLFSVYSSAIGVYEIVSFPLAITLHELIWSEFILLKSTKQFSSRISVGSVPIGSI